MKKTATTGASLAAAMSAVLAATLTACAVVTPTSTPTHDLLNPGATWPPEPTVTGHRGASALRPEHTLAAYLKAIEDGADVVEPDLVITRDGVLVARHENDISGTTDVASRPEFAARKSNKRIDGQAITGWFTEDFTLAELKTLRAVERIPANRPANAAYDGRFEVPTLQEVVDLVKQQSSRLGRPIGIYPETKHPTYFKSIGLPLEKPLVDLLKANGYTGRDSAVLIQSFEVANLKELAGMGGFRLVQLIDNPGNPVPRNAPYDQVAAGTGLTYGDMAKPAGLKAIAAYAQYVSPYKEVIIPRTAAHGLGAPTSFIKDAHAAGLKVHAWTFRPENPFLPTGLRAPDAASLSQRGDAAAEITAYLKAGLDGFFTDDPAVGRAAVDAGPGKARGK